MVVVVAAGVGGFFEDGRLLDFFLRRVAWRHGVSRVAMEGSIGIRMLTRLTA